MDSPNQIAVVDAPRPRVGVTGTEPSLKAVSEIPDTEELNGSVVGVGKEVDDPLGGHPF
jgi:hypothetical protein